MEFYRPPRKPLTVTIIPLIDIFAILLIFFIVSTTFKKPRPILTINLPTVKEMPSQTVVEERGVIAVAPDGTITLDQLEVPPGLLSEFIGVYQQRNPGRQFELKADEGVRFGQVFEIWDALTKAGIKFKEVPVRIKVLEEGKEEE